MENSGHFLGICNMLSSQSNSTYTSTTAGAVQFSSRALWSWPRCLLRSSVYFIGSIPGAHFLIKTPSAKSMTSHKVITLAPNKKAHEASDLSCKMIVYDCNGNMLCIYILFLQYTSLMFMVSDLQLKRILWHAISQAMAMTNVGYWSGPPFTNMV